MSVLTYLDTYDLVREGGLIEDCDPALIGPGSVDLRLGYSLLVEDIDKGGFVDLAKNSGPPMRERPLANEHWSLFPGEFALASTIEKINMPDNLTAIVLLRSSAARSGVDHAFAGLVDPGFEGQLTLELKNNLSSNRILLKPLLPIAQIVFFSGRKVPAELSYKVRGRYGKQKGPTPAKGLFKTEGGF